MCTGTNEAIYTKNKKRFNNMSIWGTEMSFVRIFTYLVETVVELLFALVSILLTWK